MSECERLEACTFFSERMSDMPAMSFVFRERYCRGDWKVCARHRVVERLGAEAVPPDLYPNQSDKADRLLHEMASA